MNSLSPSARSASRKARGLSMTRPRQLDGRVDLRPPVVLAPAADGVEVLHGETERIHPAVAARTDRTAAVQLHPLAQRCRVAPVVRLERRHVGRRRRRRRPQQGLQHPLPAQHHRRPIRVGRHRQQARMAQQAVPPIVVPRVRAGSGCRRRRPRRSGGPTARSGTCSRPAAAPGIGLSSRT